LYTVDVLVDVVVVASWIALLPVPGSKDHEPGPEVPGVLAVADGAP
jgi:hypothetical protein